MSLMGCVLVVELAVGGSVTNKAARLVNYTRQGPFLD